jgi:hypothetical protein
MLGPRLFAALTVLRLALTDRAARLAPRDDRGSETVDKVLWIALTVVIVLAVYGIFNGKILAKIESVNLG